MKFTNNTLRRLIVLSLIVLTISSCKKFQGDITVPSFIHIDAINVVPQSTNAPSSEPGFYTSLIDGVFVEMYFEGDASVTQLGTFTLPCTIPVLAGKDPKYVTIYPFVKQNGMASTRIPYPFYQKISLTDVHLSPDSITDLGTLNTNYYTRDEMTVLTEDYFEPTAFSTHFDSIVTWVANDPENACTGLGYGLVHLTDTQEVVTFTIRDLIVSNTYLYLEMEYQTDVELYISLFGYLNSTESSYSALPVMCLLPNDHWQKVYVNLGRTESNFVYHSPLQVFFQANNPDKKEANIKLDNVKLLTLR